MSRLFRALRGQTIAICALFRGAGRNVVRRAVRLGGTLLQGPAGPGGASGAADAAFCTLHDAAIPVPDAPATIATLAIPAKGAYVVIANLSATKPAAATATSSAARSLRVTETGPMPTASSRRC